MKVSEAEARRLLAAAKKASEKSRRAQQEMLDAADERAAAVRACMEAGISRAQIAEAAGVAVANLYRIIK